MIDGIGKAGSGRLELVRSSGERTDKVAKAGDTAGRVEHGIASPVSEMAAKGPPVDAEKIAAVRAAIAQGRYPVDADRIAASMIALDLGAKGAQ